jgi:hypothetical protein
VIEGTLIRLQPGHLPGDRDPKPVWLWCSATGRAPGEVDRLWQASLRRFDLEHTFRLFNQVLGWTIPKIRDPQVADRWTWLIIACHAQLRLARLLADDLRLPWNAQLPRAADPGPGPPGFRNIRATMPCLAGAPKPGKLPAPAGRQDRRTAAPPPPRRGQVHQTRTQPQSQARTRRVGWPGGLSAPGSHGSVREPRLIRLFSSSRQKLFVHRQCANSPGSRLVTPFHHALALLNDRSRLYFLRTQRRMQALIRCRSGISAVR